MVSVGQEFGDDLAGLGVSHAVEHRQWLELASVSPSWRWKASPWTLREVQFGLPPNVESSGQSDCLPGSSSVREQVFQASRSCIIFDDIDSEVMQHPLCHIPLVTTESLAHPDSREG